MKKITHEMQGFAEVPAETEDEVWLPDGKGGLIKLEVADDVEND